MLRKVFHVLLVIALFFVGARVYLRLVVEPCVRDISRAKLQERDLLSQRDSLESASLIPGLNAREKRSLSGSRRKLQARLMALPAGSDSWLKLAGRIRAIAAQRGLRIRALEGAPITPAEHRQTQPLLEGAFLWRVTARVHGPLQRWGGFLKAVSSGPAYLTLARFEILEETPLEARMDWLWHAVAPGNKLSPGRSDLVDWEGDLLNQRLPVSTGAGRKDGKGIAGG